MPVIFMCGNCHDIIALQFISVHNHLIWIQMQHGYDLSLFFRRQNLIVLNFAGIIIIYKLFCILIKHLLIKFSGLHLPFQRQIKGDRQFL